MKPKRMNPWKQFFMIPAVRWAWFLPGAILNLIALTIFMNTIFINEDGFFVKYVPLPFNVRQFIITGPITSIGIVWFFIANGVRIAPKHPFPVAIVMATVFLCTVFGVQTLHNMPLNMSLDNLFYTVIGIALGMWSAYKKHLRLIREQEDAKVAEMVGAYGGAYPRNLEGASAVGPIDIQP